MDDWWYPGLTAEKFVISKDLDGSFFILAISGGGRDATWLTALLNAAIGQSSEKL